MSTTGNDAVRVNRPDPPTLSGGPQADWLYRDLYERVIKTLYALPSRFRTPLRIEGVPATDLFTMNSALGAAIEISVVDSLNELRSMWDPQNQYADYSFVRQSQRFPDVLLKTKNPNSQSPLIIMGIELKGWFLLSKEGEPSFRYKISPHCCSEADLLVVIPWLFDSVISGAPQLMEPIITEASFAAKRRNYHWEWVRASKNQLQEMRGIIPAPHVGTYPPKTARSSDMPVSDSGGNFGRIARCGVMDADVASRLREDALGIPVDAWRQFLKIFSDGVSPAIVSGGLAGLANAFEMAGISEEERMSAAEMLNNLAEKIRRQDVSS